jgi:hypothetical protein
MAWGSTSKEFWTTVCRLWPLHTPKLTPQIQHAQCQQASAGLGTWKQQKFTLSFNRLQDDVNNDQPL